MKDYPQPIDLRELKVQPLAERQSLSSIEKLLTDPAQEPRTIPAEAAKSVENCARKIIIARERNASVMLLYGAHLIKNGAQRIVIRLLERGWITHPATNGAGTIHDWELAFLGRTEENVKKNVAIGTFGAWDETGRHINL